MSIKFIDSISHSVSRRSFLNGITVAGVGSLMGPSLLTKAIAAVGKTKEVLTAAHWGAMRALVDGGRWIKAMPFEKDYAPLKSVVASSPEAVYSRSRVKFPMVRAGYLKDGIKSDTSERGKGRFVRVSWDTALDLVANEIKRVRSQHGPASLFTSMEGWRSSGALASMNGCWRLLNAAGGFTGTHGNYSFGADQAIMPHFMGEVGVDAPQTAWPTVIDHAKLVVLWGANPMVTSQMAKRIPLHEPMYWFARLKDSDIEVVSVDPIRSESVDYFNGELLSPRPGTDVAMMLGVAHTLYTEKLHDQKFLDKYTTGFDKFLPYLLGKTDGTPKTAEWAAGICKVDAEAIKVLARKMAKVRTMIMSGWSIQRQDHGEQAHWMLGTLACMLGDIGLPGGGFSLCYHRHENGCPKGTGGSIGLLPVGKAPKDGPKPITVARFADALLNPGMTIDFNGKKEVLPDIKLIYWAGGNPFAHHQDRNKLIRAWQKPETIIVNEIAWSATAKFADIVLPACTAFERNDIDTLGHTSGRGIFPMHQVVDPVFESRSDFWIFNEIAKRLGVAEAFNGGRDEIGWIRWFYDKTAKAAKAKKVVMPDFDTFWKGGEHIEFAVSDKAKKWVKFADFRNDPLLEPLGTPSGKFEIYSKTIEKMGYDDCGPHPTWYEPVEWLGSDQAKKYPLHVISVHPDRRIHSQYNYTAGGHDREVQGRQPMWINTKDAETRGIKDGDVVRVFNDRGELLAGAVVSDRNLPGVIRFDEGVWYDPAKPGQVDTICKHGAVNQLTIDKGTSKLAQACIADTALAQVEKFTDAVPPMTAFDPPTVDA